MNTPVSFDSAQFDRIFPFYILLDEQLIIVSCGRTIGKIMPGINGNRFTNFFTIKRPELPAPDFSTLKALVNQLVIIECNCAHIILLRGQFELMAGDAQLLFIGSPWFGSMEQVIENKLQLDDFALHDPMIDLLHVIKAQEITTEDLKKLLQTVKRQKEELHILSSIAAQNTHGVVIADREGKIEWINKSFETMSGYTIEDLKGKKPGHVLQGKDTNPETIVYLRNQIEKGEPFVCEILNYRKTGEPYWLRLMGQALKDRGGNVINYFSIEEDITHIKESERALKESEAKYRDLVENISEIVYETNETGVIRYISPSVEKIMGFTQDEVIGKNYNVFLGFDDNTVFEGLKTLAAQKVLFNEYRMLDKTGRPHWMHLSTKALFRDGVFKGASGMLVDITELKTTQLELEKLSLVASANRLGVHFSDPERIITYANEALLKMTGYNVEELVGRSPVDLFYGPLTQETSIHELSRGHKEFVPVDVDIILYRKDRSWFWANVKKQPLEKSSHLVQEFFSILEDITERKIQERTLKQKEEKYRNIIANMRMGLLETDNNDIISYANQQFSEMTGFSIEEVLGKKSIDLLVPESYRQIVKERNLSRKEGISDTYELKIRIRSGEERWWLTGGGPNFNDKGELIGTIGISVDITEQKALEEELMISRKKAEESSKAKESFLANMSHEIRTPLNAVIGMIREISREPLTPKQSVYIRNAGLASQHLLSIVNDILDITKIESGQLSLEHHAFSLKQVIDNAISILMPVASEKKLKLFSSMSGSLAPAYMGDSSRIKQILLNIINNAIKFTEKGKITVDCKVTEKNDKTHSIRLKVTDTGIGMDEDFLDHVFDKFSQGEISTARKFGGTGLGLAITRELVQLMNGTIQVKSKKGVGTTIEIVLDLEPGIEASIETVSTPENFQILKNRSILLVEDNDLNRLVARNALAHYGINVTEVTNGSEAIEKLKEKTFDIILMDLQMPVMDGLAATKIIRKQINLQTPVIALTANAFKAERDRCLEAGMNDYITKPFEENALLGAILRNIPSPDVAPVSAVKELPAAGKSYDLDYIVQFSRGNPEFVNKMIRLFIEQMPVAVNEIKTAMKELDPATISKTAHRIKPNIDNFGIDELKQDIRTIEVMTKNGTVSSELELLIQRLDSVIARVVRELEKELK